MKVDVFVESFNRRLPPGSREVIVYDVEVSELAQLADIYKAVHVKFRKTLNAKANVTEVQTDLGCYLPREGQVYLRSRPVYKTWEQLEADEEETFMPSPAHGAKESCRSVVQPAVKLETAMTTTATKKSPAKKSKTPATPAPAPVAPPPPAVVPQSNVSTSPTGRTRLQIQDVSPEEQQERTMAEAEKAKLEEEKKKAATPKASAKLPTVTTKHGEFRKGSVLLGIYESWDLKGGSTPEETLERLAKAHPERNKDDMMVTIRTQIGRMPKERNFFLGRDEKGRYGLHIEGKATNRILGAEALAKKQKRDEERAAAKKLADEAKAKDKAEKEAAKKKLAEEKAAAERKAKADKEAAEEKARKEADAKKTAAANAMPPAKKSK